MSRKPGCIVKRGNGYAVVLDLGKGPDGKRRRKWHSGFNTKKDADAFLKRAMHDLETGLYVEPTKLTVGEYLTRWLRDYAEPSLRPSTFESYEVMVNRHLIPAVGGLPLHKLAPLHLQTLYREKLDGGLSGRTVRYIHAVIHKALVDALKAGLVVRNVADAVQLPKHEKAPMKTLDAEGARRFLDAAKEDRLYALYLVTLTCGLRRGEALGLKWEDVDFDAATLAVRRTLQRVTGKGLVFADTKTAKSRRQVELAPHVVEALRTHRKAQLAERLALGPEYQDNGLVFAQFNGKPLHPDNIVKRNFHPLLEKAGLPQVRFHDLRHTCATLLLAQGTHPKVVQERLGHSQISITLDTYSHILPGMQREAAGKLDALLFGQTATKG